MRPKTKLAVAAAALTLVCVAGLVVLASPAAPRARLLTASEMHTLIGGSCPEEDCEEQVCETSSCPTQDTDCKKKQNVCMKVVLTPFSKCVGGHPNKKCKHESLVQGCAQVHWGMPDPSGKCGFGNCMSASQRCGSELYTCSSEACDD